VSSGYRPPTNVDRGAQRYIFAQKHIGIPLDSLLIFERSVYEEFLLQVFEVTARSEWSQHDRYSSIDPEYPGWWLSEFSAAYKQCLQFAVSKLAQHLTGWTIANSVRNDAVDARCILQVCFLFAEELSSPDFAKIWLARVTAKTKGTEIRKMIVPRRLGIDCLMLPGHDDLNEVLFMADPEALDRSIVIGFRLIMLSPIWKDKARHMAMQQIRLYAHLAPHRKRGVSGSAIQMPPLTREEITRRDSLSAKEAGIALGIKPRRIRDYIRERRLDRTGTGRVHVNNNFWKEYAKKHLPED